MGDVGRTQPKEQQRLKPNPTSWTGASSTGGFTQWKTGIMEKVPRNRNNNILMSFLTWKRMKMRKSS